MRATALRDRRLVGSAPGGSHPECDASFGGGTGRSLRIQGGYFAAMLLAEPLLPAALLGVAIELVRPMKDRPCSSGRHRNRFGSDAGWRPLDGRSTLHATAQMVGSSLSSVAASFQVMERWVGVMKGFTIVFVISESCAQLPWAVVDAAAIYRASARWRRA